MEILGNDWCLNCAVEGHEVRVFGNTAAKEPLPVVYLHTIADEGRDVWKGCLERGAPPFVLAEIAVPRWNDDMSPWAGPSLTPRGEPFDGDADQHVRRLVDRILPRVERMLCFEPKWRGLAGYSLAGLFGLYAAFRTERFDRIASVSGSLWYWGFADFVAENKAKADGMCVYLSLGDKEGRTKDACLSAVEACTREIRAKLAADGHKVIYEINEGNHFCEPEMRLVKGVVGLLNM